VLVAVGVDDGGNRIETDIGAGKTKNRKLELVALGK
jgi:hypothetical protein